MPNERRFFNIIDIVGVIMWNHADLMFVNIVYQCCPISN